MLNTDAIADLTQLYVDVVPELQELQHQIEDIAAVYMKERNRAVEALCLLYLVKIGPGVLTDYMLVEQRSADLTTRWWLQRKDES